MDLRGGYVTTYRDGRRHGWFPVYKSATQMIREYFASTPEGMKGSTALAVYGAILELANDARTDNFEVRKMDLAQRACVGGNAATKYQDALAACGVIRVDRRHEGGNLPNVVHVLDTEELDGDLACSAPEGSSAEEPSLDDSAPEGSSAQQSTTRTRVKSGEEERTTSSQEEKRPPEAVELCRLLAEHVREVLELNELPPAWDGSEWVTEARRLITIGPTGLKNSPATFEQVKWAIAWLGRDSPGAQFWRPNIQSMPTLRAKWNQVKSKIKEEAARQQRPTGGGRAAAELDRHRRRAEEAARFEGRTAV